jgi:hypothetical protein
MRKILGTNVKIAASPCLENLQWGVFSLMVEDSTVPTTSDSPILSQQDRCDLCGAQAYVLVRGMSGELMFCSHDYNDIVMSDSGKQKIEAFSFETIDERDKLIENRLIGDNV